MRNIRGAVVLVLTFGAVAFAADTKGACKFEDMDKLKTHLTSHVTYPAKGKAIKETCKKEDPTEFSKSERACAEKKIKDKTEYKSADDVYKALGLEAPKAE